MKVRDYATIFISVFLLFYLFYLGESFFVPFLIAVVLWYLIITIADGFKMIRIKNRDVSHAVAMGLSILTLIVLFSVFVSLVNSNIGKVITLTPIYQKRLVIITNNFIHRIGMNETLGFKEIIESVNMTDVLKSLTGVIKKVTSDAGIIFIYTLFLLLEYRVFKEKLGLVFLNKEKYDGFMRGIERINQDIKTYVKIKSSASLIIGVLCFMVMQAVGLDLAVFWALLIFVLNFIPTIGPVIAICFPILLSLVQFDSLLPFFIISILLIIIQAVIGSILEPRFMGKSLNLSPLVIILSLAIWGSIWGIVGMFLCIPIMVILNIILAKFEKTRAIAIMLSAHGIVD